MYYNLTKTINNMKRTKFKSNKQAVKYLRANGKYNSKHELVLNEGIKLLNYDITLEEKQSTILNLETN